MNASRKSFLLWIFSALLLFTLSGVLGACSASQKEPSLPGDDPASSDPSDSAPDSSEPTTPEPVENDCFFDGSVTHDVLCRYLSRAVHLTGDVGNINQTDHISKFILNTGAKYICRAACCWSPSAEDYKTYPAQKELIDRVHAQDPDVVFEACIFECIGPGVNAIPIPAYVFEAFDLPVEERNFSFDAMKFTSGRFKDQWGPGTTVPDITRKETQMFLYYRACAYIDNGYEALHMGQVHLIGANDTGWRCWTDLLSRIREYATEHARRHFVFINAHTHGITGADGVLLFDFHMYPSRPVTDTSQSAHAPTDDNPQKAYLQVGYSDSIYGKSIGGVTPSGWECESLPYLVELDNFGDNESQLFQPIADGLRVWGMDEITWFANQPDEYRAAFLRYAYYWMQYYAGGEGFFAMPGQRLARIYDADKTIQGWAYFGFDKNNFIQGNHDEPVIKRIWAGEDSLNPDDDVFERDFQK